MNIKQVLDNQKFSDKYILKLILQDIFNFSKEELYLNWEKEVSANQFNKIDEIYRKYKQDNIPIEYLLWYTFFMWEKFIVNENTLIPRPETEYLVNYALEEIKNIQDKKNINLWNKKWYNEIQKQVKNDDYSKITKKNCNSVIFDIWTWSGIIGINISKNISNLVICSDISKPALEIAKKNKENILWDKNNIKFIISNLWEHIKQIDSWEFKIDDLKLKDCYTGSYIICANLPYVEDNFHLDEYTKKEPKTALFAGKDGLSLYRKLLDQVIEIKNNNIILFFELMTKQVEALISEYDDFTFKILDTFHHNIKILKIKK